MSESIPAFLDKCSLDHSLCIIQDTYVVRVLIFAKQTKTDALEAETLEFVCQKQFQ